MTPKHSYPSQEIAQSVGTMPHEAEVTSSNPPSPSCVDMSKKKKPFLSDSIKLLLDAG
jgi:hypothetical protein